MKKLFEDAEKGSLDLEADGADESAAKLLLKKHKELSAAETEEEMCKICFEARINAVLIPCGHACLCVHCTNGLSHCPVCRGAIAQCVKMYKC